MPAKKRSAGLKRKPAKGTDGIQLDPRHADRTRAKIQTTQVINRLEKFVLGGEGDDMSAAQVTAAIALLRKSLPDMQAIEQKIETEIKTVATEPIMQEDEWEETFADTSDTQH